MKFAKLNAVIEEAWGPNWREDIFEKWPLRTPEGKKNVGAAGRRTLAAVLAFRMGELSLSEAITRYTANTTSTLTHCKKVVSVALDDGDYKALKLVLSGERDVCRVGRDLKVPTGPITEHIELPQDKGWLEFFAMFDPSSQVNLLRLIPAKQLDAVRKQQVARLHPDRGGTHEAMARFNHLWTSIKEKRSL